MGMDKKGPHLHEGGKAVGGARGVGDDGVGGLVVTLIHTNHVGGDGTLAWGCDQHLLGASLQPSFLEHAQCTSCLEGAHDAKC